MTSLEDAQKETELPKTIIYQHRVGKDKTQGFYPLFDLTKMLIEKKPQEAIDIYCINPHELFAAALAGFARTAQLEHPKLHYHILTMPPENSVSVLPDPALEIRYDKDHKRWIRNYVEAPLSKELKDVPLKKQGVYLITGGAGGLGLLFARYLAEHYQAKLILTGRSALKETQESALAELEKLGSEVLYVRADVTKRAELKQLKTTIKDKFGSLNGIIHSAGVIRDAFIVKKTSEDIQAVLAPKIQGTVNVDEVWQNEPLDFFVLFSSIAATFGNVGQIDYAYANGFMDNYAVYRKELKAKGKRFGESITIDWPLWAEGGMQIDEASKQWMHQVMGAEPLSTADGVTAFLSALVQKNNQAIILTGRRTKLAKLLEQTPPKSVSTTTTTAPQDGLLLEKVQTQLLKIAAELLKIKFENLDAEELLSEYGVDSIILTNFANQMNSYYQLELTPAVLFEHQTIQSLQTI